MPLTNNDLYIKARRTFKEAGISAFSLEARLIVAFASGKTKEALLRDLNMYSSTEVEKKVDELISRRLSGEPVAYITGNWEFYGVPLTITPDVLVPRADTEVLVETAVQLMNAKSSSIRILDLCTGSGCIALALAQCLPASRLILLDKDPKALSVARANIKQQDLDARAVCVEADITEPPPIRMGTFDLIVSNPPYIKTAEILTLDASVREHEPFMALDGGEDGLVFYRAILQKWKQLLKPGGYIVFEIGEDQAADLEHLMNQSGFLSVNFVKDTAGIDRVVFGKL